MACYLTADFCLDLPGPSVELALAHVRDLFDGTAPVTTKAVAQSIGCSALAIDNLLESAALSGRIHEVRGQGWLPLDN
jgi:hypothetical protein